VPLRGSIRPSGSKNGALPTLAATLLLEGETLLRNIPRITDVETMIGLLRALGLRVEELSDGALRVINEGVSTHTAPEQLVHRMRASHYLIGPLVARLKQAELPLPGGCDIGRRPVDYIIAGLEPLGVEAEVKGSRIIVTASHLSGASVALDAQYRSAGATFTVLMAAVLAEGRTVIENASFEPDVVSFCRFLNAAGARIGGIGGPSLEVRGVDGLTGATHRVNPDRLEAGTLICAAAATRGEVLVERLTTGDLGGAADKMREAGIEMREEAGGLRASCAGRLQAVSVVTEPFPGFPTDLQPPFAAVLATAAGCSAVRESIFDRRLQYVDQLVKMGAQVELLDSRRAAITGVPRLRGAEVEAHNIRDGAALMIAALSAEGQSLVWGRQFVARGYEAFESKLQSLGARLQPLARD
jgi:UDP-N-acetylglucosamine 1-carboxyvinyltransferase